MNRPSQSLSNLLMRASVALVVVLIVRVTVEVVAGYVDYLPPNFDSNFLQGREHYFFHGYQWAFYPHIASGPITLLVGVVLMSDAFRTRFPIWHRRLGRIQVICVLFLVAPSGLWMAYYTATGTIAGISFAILAVLTGTVAALGWKAAVERRFADHRRWMSRCFVLLCSAVVLRVAGGTGTYFDVKWLWFDPVASWFSWLIPLIAYECASFRHRRPAPVKELSQTRG